MSAEWTVRNDKDGMVHRICPGDQMMGAAFQAAFKEKSHLSRVRTDCRIQVSQGIIEHGTITCIACIASPMEPT